MRLIDGDELMKILTTAIRNMKGMAKFLSAEDDPEIQMEIKAYTDIANGVRDMPSAQPGQRWIPRSERCPVKEGRYLATMHPTYSHDIDIEIVCWSGRWSRWVGYDEREILAWMPLPKPYMEEEE